MKRIFRKLFRVFNPYRMYRASIVLLVLNMLLAVGFHFFGGPLAPFAQVFLSTCPLYILGALGNYWAIREIEQKSNKSEE